MFAVRQELRYRKRRGTMSDELVTSLEYLSEIQDLMDLNDFMDDAQVAEAMDLALKVLAKPDIPPATARLAMVKFQALSFKFKMMAQTYMTIKQGKAGSDENKKKNVYFSLSELCQEMTNTLKYLVRETY